MHPVQFVISIVLFLILFFGVGFLLNMFLKTTWFPGAILYPLVIIFIVSEVSFFSYFTQPGQSFSQLADQFLSLTIVDSVILLSGFVGALLSGFTIQLLRARGYRMF